MTRSNLAAVEDRLIERLDRQRAPKPLRSDHPAMLSLNEALANATQAVGPGTLFRWHWRHMRETWPQTLTSRAKAQAEALFANDDGAGQ